MSFILNHKVKIPTETDTKLRLFGIAKAIGCLHDVQALYIKFETESKGYKMNPAALEQLTNVFLHDLAKMDIRLVSWLMDENGEIRINNKVVMKLVSTS